MEVISLQGLSQADIHALIIPNNYFRSLEIINQLIETRNQDIYFFEFNDRSRAVIFKEEENGRFLYIAANRAESGEGFFNRVELNEKLSQLGSREKGAAFSFMLGRVEY